MSWVPPGWSPGSGSGGSPAPAPSTGDVIVVNQYTGPAGSEVGITNFALRKIGEDRITSLDDNKQSARIMKDLYAYVRDAEFHRRRWKFTLNRMQLPAIEQAPLSDYAYQYQLPVDYIRLVEGGDIATMVDLSDYRGGNGQELYSIEGRLLLTNLPAPLNIRYIQRVTDTKLYNPSFVAAFASMLAYEACEPITGSTSKKDACLRDYRMALREAVVANAIEGSSRSIADDSWVLARLG